MAEGTVRYSAESTARLATTPACQLSTSAAASERGEWRGQLGEGLEEVGASRSGGSGRPGPRAAALRRQVTSRLLCDFEAALRFSSVHMWRTSPRPPQWSPREELDGTSMGSCSPWHMTRLRPPGASPSRSSPTPVWLSGAVTAGDRKSTSTPPPRPAMAILGMGDMNAAHIA